VLEAIEVYQQELGKFAGSELVRWSGSAVYDVLHELACAKYGYDSHEAARRMPKQQLIPLNETSSGLKSSR
jgi:hypothetical protein